MANMKDATDLLDKRKTQILDRRNQFETGSLSTVLRIGLEDLEATERLLGIYQIDMGTYHGPDAVSGKCAVCQAGTVMAQTLGANPSSGVSPSFVAVINQMHARPSEVLAPTNKVDNFLCVLVERRPSVGRFASSFRRNRADAYSSAAQY